MLPEAAAGEPSATNEPSYQRLTRASSLAELAVMYSPTKGRETETGTEFPTEFELLKADRRNGIKPNNNDDDDEYL